MTRYTFREFAAGLYKEELEGRAKQIIAKAINDTFEATPVVPGIRKGGSRVHGTIPYDTHDLARSLNSKINGGTVGIGETSYLAVTSGFEIGDQLTFSWGGIDAPYAKYVHDGANGVRGTFWIDAIGHRFPQFLEQAAKAAK